MKLVAQTDIPPDYRLDPRSIKNPAVLKNIFIMIESSAASHGWGCPHTRLFLTGFLDGVPGREPRDLFEAGNQYQRIWYNYHRLMQTDPDEVPEIARELAYKRVERAKQDFNESREVLGLGRKIIDLVIIDEVWPSFPKEKKDFKDGLILLSNLYWGTKRKRY